MHIYIHVFIYIYIFIYYICTHIFQQAYEIQGNLTTYCEIDDIKRRSNEHLTKSVKIE